MTNLNHVPLHERKHFNKCHCGCYVDMRDLEQVLLHEHWLQEKIKEIAWSYSVKEGEAIANTKQGNKLNLN